MSSQSISREVVPGYIWAIARPFYRFDRAKIGGRASIIKLSNGDLFVISPTPIEEGTQKWVDSIGTVKYLVAPGIEVPSLFKAICWCEHYIFLKAWKELYPEAQVIGPQGLDAKITDIKFDFIFTPENLDKTFGDNEIVAHYFPGHKSSEIAFLHVPSKTLLNADLAENLPATEQFSQTGVDAASGFWTGLFIKLFSPNNWVHNFVIWHVFTKDTTYIPFGFWIVLISGRWGRMPRSLASGTLTDWFLVTAMSWKQVRKSIGMNCTCVFSSNVGCVFPLRIGILLSAS